MNRGFPIRRRRRGLGYPILPDSWPGMAFSPGTPDAIQMAVLKQMSASLPPDLQAKWDAAQAAAASSTTAAVTASGTPISTQTGAAVTAVNSIFVAPGVWLWTMSDGSSHYVDVAGNPVSYTPPAPTPATTPAAGSQPTAVVAPAVTPTPAPVPAVTPVAVTPAGAQISTTTGTPAPTSAGVVSSVEGTLDSLMSWLKGSLIGGIPNWLLVGGAVAGMMMFGGDGSSSRRRR
jgi:hypothetical protein